MNTNYKQVQEQIFMTYTARFEEGGHLEESPEESRNIIAEKTLEEILSFFEKPDNQNRIMDVADFASGPASVEIMIASILDGRSRCYLTEKQLDFLNANIGRVRFHTFDIAASQVPTDHLGGLNINHQQCDITKGIMAQDKFDLVISNLGIDLIPERHLAFQQVFKSANPGATFLFNFHHPKIAKNIVTAGGLSSTCSSAMDFIVSNNHYFSNEAQIRLFLENLGFTEVDIFFYKEVGPDPRTGQEDSDCWWQVSAQKPETEPREQ